MKKVVFLLTSTLFSISSAVLAQDNKYVPSWNSLRSHHTPQWLMDAKFGIYCHWGIQTISYEKGKENLSNEELLSQFKGENFNADEWAKLFETAGAKLRGIQYTKEDIRFTVNGDHLYATCLGKPDGDLEIASLNSNFKLRKGDILHIIHLGSGKKIQFNHNEKALVLKLDGIPLDETANVFKISLR
ncbi:alpha-L-fucosidase [Arenibacter sp. F20364]|uniref:alpha-L-fucosidase n=1 Tax=Arenibacter sp. F20364 TaxID=2926415 RepID=UPI001FF4721C|nr:alpha-L-fucosidase [Arenibacter sp. F20364]MCK0188947.1 alpha-L-fucosidase [Arenibacter sp. F20364]